MSEVHSLIEILLLEDSALDADLIGEYLRKGGMEHAVRRVWNRADFTAALDADVPDVILADYALPSFDGMSALEIAHHQQPDTPFIFVSGTLGEEMAVEAMKNGGTDYIVKERLARLPQAVKRALAEARERRARRLAEERQQLLVNELNHRVKNSLATVQAIAQQTLNRPDVPDDARRAFTERLHALARAHDVLTEESWEGAELSDVVASALDPYGGQDVKRFHVDGPSVRLPPRIALSLVMALHELATNAAKYGALSDPNGRIEIVWNVEDREDGRYLDLRWTEQDGPPVVPPEHKGFGSRLIERGLAAELQGGARVRYNPTGVVCTIDALLPET